MDNGNNEFSQEFLWHAHLVVKVEFNVALLKVGSNSKIEIGTEHKHRHVALYVHFWSSLVSEAVKPAQVQLDKETPSCYIM